MTDTIDGTIVTEDETQEVAHQVPAEAKPDSAPTRQAPGLLGVIERMATDERFDVAKMEAMLKMRAEEEERVRRIEREDRAEVAKRAFLSAFSRAQGEIGPILRNKKNDHTRSAYASLEAIEKVATPILTRHGFSTTCVPMPCSIDGHIRMRLTLGHSEGHEQVYEDDFPIDAAGSGGKVNKTPIQAKGSTQTYARRYLKASALDLAFMDDNDGNKQEVETVTADQYITLRDKLLESGMPELKFHLAFGHKDPENADLQLFPAARFEEALTRLDNYAKAAAKARDGADE